MNTMDVIYPASPLLLYANPELLRQLLEPVLAYAHNETYIAFTDPYSPHQLGTCAQSRGLVHPGPLIA